MAPKLRTVMPYRRCDADVALLLRGARWVSRNRERRGDLRIVRGRIAELAAEIVPRRGDAVVELDGHWVLPGLINAHDHLGLALLPWLGDPPYRSFYAWAEEIYRPDEPPIAEVEQVPMRERLAWGGWRNVLGGATAVAHHDPWHARAFRARTFPVSVVRCAWGHSLGFEPDLARRYRPDRPFVVHAAEGIDDRAQGEIAELDRLGVLRDNTFVVHAIALSDGDVRLLAERNSKVIWCPASNLRLYRKTTPVAALRRAGIDVLLGTDSTLSGADTLLEELRAASDTGQVDDAELLAMVTHRAADAFGMDGGHGVLAAAGRADLVVVPERGGPAKSLLAARTGDLRFVLVGGRPRLAHPEIAEQLELGGANVAIDGAPLWLGERFDRLRASLDQRLGPDCPHNRLWRRIG